MGHSTSSGRGSGGSVADQISNARFHNNVFNQNQADFTVQNVGGGRVEKAVVDPDTGREAWFAATWIHERSTDPNRRDNPHSRQEQVPGTFKTRAEAEKAAKSELKRRIEDSERRRRNAQVMDEAVRRAQRREQEERRRGREAARNMENISRRRR